MNTRRMLTVKQAAERLGLSEATIYGLVNRLDSQGRPLMSHYRPIPGSRAIRFSEEQIDQFREDGAKVSSRELQAREEVEYRAPKAPRKYIKVC